MSVIIRRQTRLATLWGPVTIYLDHKKAGKLMNHKSLELPLPMAQGRLTISRTFGKPITVQRGDTITISDHPLQIFLFWSGLIVILLSQLIFPIFSFWLRSTTGLGLLLILSSYCLSPYRIEQVAQTDPNPSQ